MRVFHGGPGRGNDSIRNGSETALPRLAGGTALCVQMGEKQSYVRALPGRSLGYGSEAGQRRYRGETPGHFSLDRHFRPVIVLRVGGPIPPVKTATTGR